MINQNNDLIHVDNMRKLFPVSRGIVGTLLGKEQQYVHAVDGVDFRMKEGEILALVGESGSGKTTTALCCAGLLPITGGEVTVEGEVIHKQNPGERKSFRKKTQIIFQDPFESLNPRQTVFDIVAEPLEIHKLASNRDQVIYKVVNALEEAGLKPAERYLGRLPNELSGGQRQRVAIASALILNPKFLIADEPVSMLDVSIRAEILNLLMRLRDDFGITILYITHDLATAAYIANRVAVMYLGKIVEIGSAQDVLGDPKHPYTRALKSVIPVPNPRRRKPRTILSGETPNPIDVPGGCRFHPRCPEAFDACLQTEPNLEEVAHDHYAACLLYS